MHSDVVILATIAHKKKASISEMQSVEYSIPYKLLLPPTKLFVSTVAEVHGNHIKLL
jgi:hypothetical protein